jgi:hypothetical protein
MSSRWLPKLRQLFFKFSKKGLIGQTLASHHRYAAPVQSEPRPQELACKSPFGPIRFQAYHLRRQNRLPGPSYRDAPPQSSSHQSQERIARAARPLLSVVGLQQLRWDEFRIREMNRVKEEAQSTLSELLRSNQLTDEDGYYFIQQLDEVPVHLISTKYHDSGDIERGGIEAVTLDVGVRVRV